MKTSGEKRDIIDMSTIFDRAVKDYVQARREKIPEFIQTHFSLSGALKINRKALGADIIKAPLNMAWALPYTAVQASSVLFAKLGLKKLHTFAGKLPPGFKTRVQQEINHLIFSELLELPQKADSNHKRKDALLAALLEQPEIKNILHDQLCLIAVKSRRQGFKKALEQRLEEYSISRTAVSELSGNIIALATGAGMLGKMTPGGISFGAGLATAIAQQSAISSFFFGPTLGGIYYGFFPASASFGLAIASTSAVLAILAIFSAFSGVISDPIQARLGLHEKRLNKLIDSLENALRSDSTTSQLKIREQYLARIFDLLDLFRSAAHTII